MTKFKIFKGCIYHSCSMKAPKIDIANGVKALFSPQISFYKSRSILEKNDSQVSASDFLRF